MARVRAAACIVLVLLMCTLLPVVLARTTRTSSSISRRAVRRLDAPADDIDWSSLTPAAVSQLTAEQLKSANATDIASIPGDSCTAFVQGQIQLFEAQQCSGQMGYCIGNLTAAAVAGLNANCVQQFSGEVTARMSTAQVSQLDAAVFPALTSDALSGFTGSCAAFSSEQVGGLGVGPNTVDACQGLQPSCVSAASDDAFTKVSSACTVQMSPSAWASLSGAQISAIADPRVFALLTVAQAGAMNASSCSGLQPAQVGALPDDGNSQPWWGVHLCAALSPACAASLSIPVIQSLSGNCGGDIQAAAFALFSAEQIQALPVNVTAQLQQQQLAQFGSVQCGVLSAEQSASFSTLLSSVAACASLSPLCVSVLPVASFSALGLVCFTSLPAAAFGSLGPEQLSALSEIQAEFISAGQVAGLPPSSCAGITPSSMGLFGTRVPYTTCSGLTRGCLASLSLQTLHSLSSSCLGAMNSSELAVGLSLEQIASLPPAALVSLGADTLVQWTLRFGSELIGTFTEDELSDATILGFQAAVRSGVILPHFNIVLPPDPMITGVSAVTAIQMAYCVSGCMETLLAPGPYALPFLLQLNPQAYRGLRGDQIAAVPPNVLGLFTPIMLSNLQSDAVAALVPAQVRALAPGNFAALSALGALSVTNGAVQAVSTNQIIAVSPAHWMEQWSCRQYNNFTQLQRSLIAPPASSAFEADCAAGVPPAPPAPAPCEHPVEGISRTVFIGSLVGAAVGTAILSALFFSYCRPSLIAHTGAQAQPQSQWSAENSFNTAGGAGRGPRSRQSARHTSGFMDAAGLRQPLNPSAASSLSGGGGHGVTSVAPVGLMQGPPTTYPVQADDDEEEDDLMGSRF